MNVENTDDQHIQLDPINDSSLHYLQIDSQHISHDDLDNNDSLYHAIRPASKAWHAARPALDRRPVARFVSATLASRHAGTRVRWIVWRDVAGRHEYYYSRDVQLRVIKRLYDMLPAI